MISVSVNPEGVEDEYLRCLNLCFGNWGDGRQYHWYFKRKTAHPGADLMVLEMDGRIAAGSAVTYRTVTLPNDEEIGVGIMTGSWTLPEFRGRGCFARIIEESVKLTAGKGGALLLAFVMEENASFRQLAKAGAALFPASYLASTLRTETPAATYQLDGLRESERVIKAMFGRLRDGGRGRCRFVYAAEDDFCSQFVRRPGATELLGDGRGNFGVVEKKEDTDVLQLCLAEPDDERGVTSLLAAFLRRALEKRRRLFLYSTRPAVARAAEALGLGRRAGHLAALAADWPRLQDALKTAARASAEDSSALAREGGPLFLGRWDVQGGDRA